jgi:hypothetical protein
MRAAERGTHALPLAPALALMLIVAVSADLSAHRRDEYLQAARLAIEPDRVELQLDLTPGIAVADRVIADIDRDRDSALSAAEKRAYVAQVLSAIALTLDSQSLDVRVTGASFPDLEAFRRGEGTIQLQLDAALPRLSDGPHQLAFRNEHFHDIGVYLANALVPDSDRVAVRSQRRDIHQRDLTVEYDLRGGLEPATRAWLLGGFATAAILAALLLRRYEAASDHRFKPAASSAK